MIGTTKAGTDMNMLKNGWARFLIAAACVLVYWPTFSGGFMLDDKPLIQYNPYLTKLQPLSSYFDQEDGVLEKEDDGSYHTGYYRPLINFSYWLDYTLWGMDAKGFRTTNLILHVICCIVLLKWLELFNFSRIAAFFVALLFAVHPVNTESVSWIVSRNNIIVTLFSLLSFICYIKFNRKSHFIYYLFSIVFFGLALFSKEYGVMILLIIVIYVIIIEKPRTGKSVKSFVFWHMPFAFILFVYFILRQNATQSWLSPEGVESLFRSIYFAPYILLMNVKMVLAPYGLHSYVLKYPDSYGNIPAILGIGFCILLVYMIWTYRKQKIIVFSILSFLVAISPVMNIVSTSALSLISMRWMYFPMVFLAPLACFGFSKAIHTKKSIGYVLAVSIGLYFSGYTFLLNEFHWKNEDTFFRSEIHNHQNTYYAYGYALTHMEQKNYEKAEKYFRMAIDGYHHKKAAPYIEYSGLLNQLGRPQEALALLTTKRGVPEHREERGQWHNNLGTAYFELGQPRLALSHYRKAVSSAPEEPLFWANLGGAYGSIRAYSKAVNALKKGLRVNPGSVPIKKNLVQTYIRMEQYRDALNVLKTLDPQVIQEDKKLGFFWNKAVLNLSRGSNDLDQE